MSLLIVGSAALDTIHTPNATYERLLGGSASYASVAASLFCSPKLVGVVGSDFPAAYIRAFEKRGIDTTGLSRAEGPTFFWEGAYEPNMNQRRTIQTILGVFENFQPILSPAHRRPKVVFLANIAPSVQLRVLDQLEDKPFVAADTMDLWINTARNELEMVLRRIDLLFVNDSEARSLSGEGNLFKAAKRIRRMGPDYVVVKKGEHGAFLVGPDRCFLCPAYPLEEVVDPTGAGDSFAGAVLGYLALQSSQSEHRLPHAMMYGAVVASFCCEGPGLRRLLKLKRDEVEERLAALERMCSW